jgi:hypothetical protein
VTQGNGDMAHRPFIGYGVAALQWVKKNQKTSGTSSALNFHAVSNQHSVLFTTM